MNCFLSELMLNLNLPPGLTRVTMMWAKKEPPGAPNAAGSTVMVLPLPLPLQLRLLPLVLLLVLVHLPWILPLPLHRPCHHLLRSLLLLRLRQCP